MGQDGRGHLTREVGLQIMLSPEELAAVDNFRFTKRMPSRAAAVRFLLGHGIAAVANSNWTPPKAGSGAIGVLRNDKQRQM